jgi:methyl-accepting chemotaxis protein
MRRLEGAEALNRRSEASLAAAAGQMNDDLLQLRRFEKDIIINVESLERVKTYRLRWDDAFIHLRHDLALARLAAPYGADERLQEAVDSLARYHAGFVSVYQMIIDGTLSTTQQANAEMLKFKDPAHIAEHALDSLSDTAPRRSTAVADVVSAQRVGLIVSLCLLGVVVVIAVLALKQPPAAIPA